MCVCLIHPEVTVQLLGRKNRLVCLEHRPAVDRKITGFYTGQQLVENNRFLHRPRLDKKQQQRVMFPHWLEADRKQQSGFYTGQELIGK